MIFDRFKNGYEVFTSKSIDKIIDEIQYRTKRQKENKIDTVFEPVKYKKLKISNNQIIVERQPGLFNPFAGFGSIIFDLDTNSNGTRIKCSIDPLIRYYLATFCLFSIVPIIMTVTMIISIQKISISSFAFIMIIWIFFIGIAYFSLVFNRSNLINYSKTILYDLGLLESNKN